MKEVTALGKGLEVPCQNTFKDNPTFIKRLHHNVLVAKNLFLAHCGSCSNADLSKSHYWN